ncbi:hypothetical protein predicted by Glimmer/Critica [Acetobacter senegalensis]|uniref:Uncharacterized protein n=1 Tax=Acetobacter senegalensis TaxID=446692 RepID=A0A0U5B7S9_9PROT|nr:hypothetical protein predicted by Glimmer/Critica [Acetobacter senegalensis]
MHAGGRVATPLFCFQNTVASQFLAGTPLGQKNEIAFRVFLSREFGT